MQFMPGANYAGYKVEERLVHIPKPLFYVPSLAIHLKTPEEIGAVKINKVSRIFFCRWCCQGVCFHWSIILVGWTGSARCAEKAVDFQECSMHSKMHSSRISIH